MVVVFLERIKNVDKWLVIPYFILASFSIIMVYSASSYNALQNYGNPHHYLPRQAIFVFIGFILAFAALFFPFRLLRNKRFVMFGVFTIFVLLFILMFFGEEIYGARRWIVTPFFNIQPAEFAKFVVVWYFAYILSRKQNKIANEFFQAIVKPCIMVGAIVLLIFIQPDTGSSFIIVVIGAAMIFASGVSPKMGLIFGGGGFLSLIGLLSLIRRFGEQLQPILQYRYNRFLGWWDPFAVSDSYGLQLVNSYYALSNGGIFGVGIGNSVQKTGYLPFPYTDFIVSIIGEELGLLGVLFVLSLFTLMVSRMYLIGIRTKRSFDSILCIGIATMFMVQGFINLGGVIGILPITGVTFPFISYGGSSMMVLAVSIGLVANVSARENIRRKETYKTKES